MATFGTDILAYFYEKIGQPYTSFTDTPTTNRLFQQALYQAIESKYRVLAEQREFDNLTAVIKTEVQYIPVGGQLTLTSTGIVNDYLHLLAIKCKFTSPLYITLSGATNATPIVITVNERSNLRTGDNIEITTVIGNTNANGVFYIKKLSDFKFSLYSDIDLQVPVAGNAAYISGGTISRVYYKYAKLIRSDNKISTLATPTVDYPRYETVTNLIKIYPANCQEVLLDYVTTAAVLIDVSNNTTDLELTYSYQFLQFIITTAASIFSGEVKDGEQQRTQEIDLSKTT